MANPLLEAARREERGPAPICGVGRLLTNPPPGLTADQIAEAIASDVQATALARALQAWGVELGDHVIQRHRRRRCACE